ncbi:uncharacterized protein LOC141665150 [Apium graveolens]|uniref:uncharacterized protein LOC141665150 n=1 Tax=Apium graveolens TaxID=4045 RepID=UPI003D78D5D2
MATSSSECCPSSEVFTKIQSCVEAMNQNASSPLLRVVRLIDFEFGANPTSLYLWNSATKQSKLTPQHDFDRWEVLSDGFGFDPIDNDFKVLLCIGPPNVTAVYSTTKNIWQVKQNAINLFIANSNGPVQLHLILTNVTSLNNSIVVILSEKGFTGKISLWTLDNVEYVCGIGGGGVEASWTRILNISVDLPVKFVHCYSTNGDLLLGCRDSTWFSYNFEKKEVFKIPASEHWQQVFKYTESLVSILGSKQSGMLTKMITR